MAPKQRTLNDSWPAPNKRRTRNPSKDNTTDDSKQNKKQKSDEQQTTSHTKSSSKSEPTPKTSTSNPTLTLTLTHTQASLFDSPPTTLLCHATNAQGTWGAGIAAAFKKSYPSAFKVYAEHCKSQNTSDLLGTALLIPPQSSSASKSEREARHWVGCLFTSERRGKGKGAKESILQATDGAVRDLLRQVKGISDEKEGGSEKKEETKAEDSGEAGGGRIGEVRMCKINSGLFGVPWEETCEVIEGIEIGDGDVREIAVLSLD